MAIGGYKTEEKHVEMAFRVLEREAAAVLKELPLVSAVGPQRRLTRL